MLFLVDASGTKYTYLDLMDAINSSNEYFPYYQNSNIYSYFLNLIRALLANQNLVLLDSDLSASEIEDGIKQKINQSKNITLNRFTSVDEIINAVINSTSEITIFTSGTTGQPKKVVHTIKTLIRNVRFSKKYKNNRWAYAFSPTHMAGLQVFFQGFLNQCTFINVFNLKRSNIFELIQRYEVTHISSTPTFYRLLLPFEKPFLSVIQATLGGEKSDEKLYENIKKIFPNATVKNVYASTEAGSLFIATNECFQIPEKLCNKIKIQDQELLIHRSLLGRSDTFQFSNDYFHSGDLIEWVNEPERIFRFIARKNELINIGGYKVNPTEVESVLLSIDGIQQALVYGRKNSILGNILCADIQRELGNNISEVEIQKLLKMKLQEFKIPRRIKFVNTLLSSRTGKLKRV